MNKSNKNIDSLKLFKSATREIFIEKGFNDGRFLNKIVPNKKKEFNKKSCRNWKDKNY